MQDLRVPAPSLAGSRHFPFTGGRTTPVRLSRHTYAGLACVSSFTTAQSTAWNCGRPRSPKSLKITGDVTNN